MAVAAIVGSPATTKVAAEPLFPPAVLPVSLYAAVAEACRQVEAADRHCGRRHGPGSCQRKTVRNCSAVLVISATPLTAC